MAISQNNMTIVDWYDGNDVNVIGCNKFERGMGTLLVAEEPSPYGGAYEIRNRWIAKCW